MNQKGLAPIIIIILVGVALLCGYFIYRTKTTSPQPAPTPSPIPTSTSTPQSSPKPTPSTPIVSQTPSSTIDACSYDGAPFNPHPFKRKPSTRPDYSATGVVNVKGLITTITVRFFGQETKGVFIRVKQNDIQNKDFYDEYIKRIETGNTINEKDGTDLLFKLGALEDGSFTTSADVSLSIKNEIEKAINSGTPLELQLSITLPPQRGADAHSSLACLISKP